MSELSVLASRAIGRREEPEIVRDKIFVTLANAYQITSPFLGRRNAPGQMYYVFRRYTFRRHSVPLHIVTYLRTVLVRIHGTLPAGCFNTAFMGIGRGRRSIGSHPPIGGRW